MSPTSRGLDGFSTAENKGPVRIHDRFVRQTLPRIVRWPARRCSRNLSRVMWEDVERRTGNVDTCGSTPRLWIGSTSVRDCYVLQKRFLPARCYDVTPMSVVLCPGWQSCYILLNNSLLRCRNSYVLSLAKCIAPDPLCLRAKCIIPNLLCSLAKRITARPVLMSCERFM